MAMDTLNTETVPTPHPEAEETEAERQARIAWEAEGIAKARASIAAGYYATEAEVDAWIDSLGTDHPLPAPYPRQSRPL
jgi:predicted transcriptional regulator